MITDERKAALAEACKVRASAIIEDDIKKSETRTRRQGDQADEEYAYWRECMFKLAEAVEQLPVDVTSIPEKTSG